MKRPRFRRSRMESGWTFLETIIVMAIMLILSGGVVFLGSRYVERSRVARAENEIGALVLALEAYYLDTGRYPTAEQGLGALTEAPLLEPVPTRWMGPYLNRPVDRDPWGTPYRYTVPGPARLPFDLVSYGADTVPGGTGMNGDITWAHREAGS